VGPLYAPFRAYSLTPITPPHPPSLGELQSRRDEVWSSLALPNVRDPGPIPDAHTTAHRSTAQHSRAPNRNRIQNTLHYTTPHHTTPHHTAIQTTQLSIDHGFRLALPPLNRLCALVLQDKVPVRLFSGPDHSSPLICRPLRHPEPLRMSRPSPMLWCTSAPPGPAT
jgi:hypothetical protein